MGGEKLTQPPLVNLFGRESKGSQYFDHYFDYRLCQRGSAFDISIRVYLEAPCEVLDTLEDVDEGVVASPYVFGRLAYTDFTTDELERSKVRRTERRTPIAENITLAGGNA